MHPVLFHLASWEVRSSHAFTALGIALGLLVGFREARRLGFSPRDILSFSAAAIPVGISGFTAEDGSTTYWCDVSPLHAGQVICYGSDPVSPGPLEFCFQRPEDSLPLCMTFPEYPDRMKSFSCQPKPTVVTGCAAITNASICIATPGCQWPTSLNRCVPNP